MNTRDHEETLCLLWDRELFISSNMCLMIMNWMYGARMVAMDTGKQEWVDNFSTLYRIAAYTYLRWDFEGQRWRT